MWKRKSAGIALALCVALAPQVAAAQWNNAPFQFKSRSFGSAGIGMSMAHRQIILERKLFGITPDIPYKDSSGALVDVVRRGSNAFIQTHPVTIVPGYGASLGSVTVQTGGFVLRNAGGFSGSTGIGVWPGMLATDSPYRVSLIGLSPASGSSIDSWISQLDTLNP